MANDKEYILEYVSMGRYLKVTAVDPETGKEASAIGPQDHTSRQILVRTAIGKLKIIIPPS